VRFGVGLAVVGAGVGVRVGSSVGEAVGEAVGKGLPGLLGSGRVGLADGDPEATATGVSAAAVPENDSATTGSTTRATDARKARTRTGGMSRCYGTFLSTDANLLGELCVVAGMSAAGVTSGGGPVAVMATKEDALTALYTAHYRELVRLAAFLTGDRDNAEEIVQDAYVKVHGSWRGLREPDKGQAYLRAAVVNLSRSRLRRRQVVARHRPEPQRDLASAETLALEVVQREELLEALHRLPRRQREAVVLRYYGDLTEAQTAATMGCSVGAVKSHTSRAITALRPLLEGPR
jgi:RNA polymerase sigma-70 factor (sigma-E family)